MNLRTRLIAFAGICLLAGGGAVAYFIHSQHDVQKAQARATSGLRTGVPAILGGPRIVFRNTELGTSYGDVAMVSLADPQGARAVAQTSCDRVYATTAYVLCLSSDRGVATTYAAHVLNNAMQPIETLPLTGIPSRARLSADGRYAATTSFVSGDSYAGTSFSTRTVISTVPADISSDLESYTLIHDGTTIAPADRNIWGVTFAADDDTFYATVKWSSNTWLVRGSISKRTIVTLHEDAECPSLSPDGQHIVFKQRANLPVGQWRLAAYDVADGSVTTLSESRSVDDQVEWLDNSHVVYGLPRTGTQAAVDDVWSVPITGSGTPVLLIPQAWSPAVVR